MNLRAAIQSRGAKWAFALVVIALLGWFAIVATIRSGWFAEKVRARIEAEIETAIGVDATVGSFRFGDDLLTLIIEQISLRGLEADDEPALLTIDRVELDLLIRSFFGPSVSLERLQVWRPRAYVTLEAGGSTNLPAPPTDELPTGSVPAEGSPVQPLLDLAVKHLAVSDGLVVWNGKPYEASVEASDAAVSSSYHRNPLEYAVELSVGRIDWVLPGIGSLPTAMEATLALSADQLGLQSVVLENDALSVEAEGVFSNFAEPEFVGSYLASADLARLVSLAGSASQSAALSGSAALDGEIKWAAATDGEFSYSGTASVTALKADASDEAADGGFAYEGDRDRLELSNIQLNALNSSLSGRAAATGLDGTPTFETQLELAGLSIARLGAVTGSSFLPWDGLLNATIVASGPSVAALSGSTEFALTPQAVDGKLPLGGRGKLSWTAGRQLTISGVDISSPYSALRVDGALDSQGVAAVKVVARSTSLEEANQILEQVIADYKTPPLSLRGAVSLDGTLTGKLAAPGPVFDGAFRIDDFSYRQLDQQLDWTSLDLDLAVSAAGANVRRAELVGEAGTLAVAGEVPFDPQADLSLQAEAHGLRAAQISEWLGQSVPLDGLVSADAVISGSQAEPSAAGSVMVTELVIAGEPFERLSAKAGYAGGAVEVSDVVLTRGESSLNANGRFDSDTKRFEFDAMSSRWPLEEFAFMRDRASPITGVLRFDLKGRGHQGAGEEILRSLEVTGSWEASELRRGEIDLGFWKGDIQTVDERVNVNWQARMLDGEAEGETVLDPRGEARYSGGLRFNKLGTKAVAEFVRLPLTRLEGQLAGQAEYSGELGDPSKFEINGTIDRFDASISGIGPADAGYQVSNVFPMRWAYANELVRLDSMNLAGSGTDVEIDGTISLADERPIDVSVNGRFNLVLLEGFDASLDSSGRSVMDLNIKGSVEHPVVEGSVTVTGGSLRMADFPNGLSDIDGRVDFTGRQMRVEELTATSGGGQLRLTGITIFGDDGPEYRMRAGAERVRVRYPANVSSVMDGQLTLAGTGTRSLLSGEVLISRMSTSKNLGFSDLLASFSEPGRTQAAGSGLDNIQLNVRVGSAPHLPIETSLVRNVEAEIDLRVVGTAASPALLGSINVSQGQINVIGTRYYINRGDVRFVNPFRIEPVLNVELETRIRDVDIALVLSGPTRKLNLNYRSDPPLPFNDLVNLVAVGKAPTIDPVLASRQRVEQQSLIQTGANNVLTQTLARPVSQRLQRFFGVSRLKVDPQIGGPEANPSARISTEQQITNDLTLTYSYDLSSAQQQVIRVEWAPNRTWSFIVTRDENGLVGSDFLYKTRLP